MFGVNEWSEKKKKRICILAYIGYVIVLYILFIGFFKTVFAASDRGKLFIYSFTNIWKLLFSIFEVIICAILVYQKIGKRVMTETILLLLELLYFVPGFIFQVVTDMEWNYIVFYLSFWLMMELWCYIIKPQKSCPFFKLSIKMKNTEAYISVLTLLCVAIACFFTIYIGRDFSISKIIYTLNNVYEVRAEQPDMHWILVNIEYWACYMGTVLITYHIEKKRYVKVAILLVAELSLFTIQGNRIFIFITIIAVLVGVLKISNKKIVCFAILCATIMLIECVLYPRGSIVTDVFRRYAISTNRISEQYFDFFLTHEPDFLRTTYSRILTPLGFPSPYENPPIAKIIGNTYYGWDMGANTGMVGGSFGVFGYFSLLVSSFGYIYAFRLFEGVTYKLRSTGVVIILAIILATLSINTTSILASIFNLTYFMLMYVSLALMTKRSVTKENCERENMV